MKGFKPSQKLKARLSRNTLLWAFTGLLVFSASVMATTGLAWFTVSNTTYVQNLSVSYAGEEFQITNIKNRNGTELDSENLLDQKNIQIPGVLQSGEASSMFTSDWYDVEDETKMASLQSSYEALQKGEDDFSFAPALRKTYNSTGVTTKTAVAVGGRDYISFIFDFTNNQDTYVYLTQYGVDGQGNEIGTWVKPDEATNEALIAKDPNNPFWYGEGGVENLNKAANAVRVSFLSNMGYKILEPNPEVEGVGSSTVLAGKLDLNPWDGYYDTDDQGKEILYGEYSDEALTRLENSYVQETSANEAQRTSNSFVAASKQGAYRFNQNDLAGTLAHEKTYTLNELGVNYRNENGSRNPLLFIKANTTERVVVSIYCEGWDRDCTNAAYLAATKVHLAFSARYAPYGYDGKPMFARPAV